MIQKNNEVNKYCYYHVYYTFFISKRYLDTLRRHLCPWSQRQLVNLENMENQNALQQT